RDDGWQRLIAELMARIGTPTELLFERREVSSSDFYHRIIELVQGAEPGDDILVMSSHRLEGQSDHLPLTEAYEQANEAYSRAVLQKAAEAGITYRHIVCFEEGPVIGKISSHYLRPWLVEHCRQVLQLRNAKPDKVFLKKSVSIFDAEVLIIGKRVAA